MIDIEKLADDFFEFPDENNKQFVTYTSAKFFAEYFHTEKQHEQEPVAYYDPLSGLQVLKEISEDGAYLYTTPPDKAQEIAELKAKIKDLEIQNVLYKDDDLEGKIAIAELQAHINVLREALEHWQKLCLDNGRSSSELSIPSNALAATPAQSLVQHDNEMIEKCAKVCEEIVIESAGRADLTSDQCAEAIRAMKGKE